MNTFFIYILLFVFSLVVVFHFVSFFTQGGFSPRSDYRFFLLTHLGLIFLLVLLWLLEFDLLDPFKGLQSLKVAMGMNGAFVLACFLRVHYPQSRRATLRLPIIGALLCYLLPFFWSYIVVTVFFTILFTVLVLNREQLSVYWRVFWKVFGVWLLLFLSYFLPTPFAIKKGVILLLLSPLAIFVYQFLNLSRAKLQFKNSMRDQHFE